MFLAEATFQAGIFIGCKNFSSLSTGMSQYHHCSTNQVLDSRPVEKLDDRSQNSINDLFPYTEAGFGTAA